MTQSVRNAKSLSTSKGAIDALAIIESAYDAASPATALKAHISANKLRLPSGPHSLGAHGRVCLIAYGKAASPMAEAADKGASINDGVVVILKGSRRPKLGSRYAIYESTHPAPSSKSVLAANAILEKIDSLCKDDYVLFMVSGGGSAMLASPLNISLSNKIRTTNILTRSAASISEINCVRRCLSNVKGGGLVSGMKCKGAAFLMSDVRGDKPYDIASGCTYKNPTSFADALAVIARYRLGKKMPKSVMDALRKGKSNKPQKRPRQIPNVIIASNRNCTDAMTLKAKRLGYRVTQENSYGDIDSVAKRICARLGKDPMSCVIFGGEPTIKPKQKGKGGRNHELVARILYKIKEKGIVVASVGTDGVDANSQAAGALAESATISNAEIARHLAKSNSGPLFAHHGRQVITGHTGTNLQDVGILLRRK